MKRALRILGIVACLATIWFVTRGSNGCAPTPDVVVLEVYSPEVESGDNSFDDAEIYGSGKLGKLDKEVYTSSSKKKRKGTVAVMWYAGLQGDNLEGVLTVISKNKDKHTHGAYSVTKGQGTQTVELLPMVP
ncbi:MAG: hypothetical protein C4532_11675 [Candidatus Abyssobacteria bacterium SURF_17]|uniref:Uncharacterized protein n=1 Tax=Candidatus Abyssobacteria bacterium SURF_17 TaxID=2093361 RepID=A0A419EWT7_9BACT|nr:MAG: hypothetical protein C4532_11675 [Candidatus Abyssubacteria bacterium SURF_17]